VVAELGDALPPFCLVCPVFFPTLNLTACFPCVGGLRAASRQGTGVPVLVCSGTTAQQTACFQNAACAGFPLGICTTNNGGVLTNITCPTCPGSKKGLLGLLGLLGLIPLFLCLLLSSLCCLIRRKKKAQDVHFATFDAGAPSVVMHASPPVAVETMHHATFAGAPHMHPGGFGGVPGAVF